ncbi:MAG: hypothetical protein M3416_07530 [Acidobacteriota bacterium]|nr:hypothetical protein [Acidobacteriota bacterium]
MALDIAEAVGLWRLAELAFERARHDWHIEADPEKKAELWIDLQMKEAVYKGSESRLKLLADKYNRLTRPWAEATSSPTNRQ